MNTRVLSWAGVLAVVVLALAVGARPSGNPVTPAARAERIAAELRCPVCQGLSVADSDSPTARDIRADILRRLDAGQSDAEVRQAYVERYGVWILLRPPAEGFGALVWVVPGMAAVLGGGGLVLALRRWYRLRTPEPDPDDRHRVEQALGRPLLP